MTLLFHQAFEELESLDDGIDQKHYAATIEAINAALGDFPTNRLYKSAVSAAETLLDTDDVMRVEKTIRALARHYGGPDKGLREDRRVEEAERVWCLIVMSVCQPAPDTKGFEDEETEEPTQVKLLKELLELGAEMPDGLSRMAEGTATVEHK